MTADMNLPKQPNNIIPSDSRRVIIDGNAFGKTLKKIASPVFDFFTKETNTEELVSVDNLQNQQEKTLMQKAITQKILNDSDPYARKKLDITI